ncbi:MAG: hypothetical protein IT374_02305 [Polyangiaceae bacterium]|nr:hypothetical protein [Polyangiaceae bacterium]
MSRALTLVALVSVAACGASDATSPPVAAGGAPGAGGAAGAAGVTVAGASGAAGSAVCVACDAYGDEVTQVPVPHPALLELSGVVASRARAGVFYAHNDSGDTARFFAFDRSGAAAGEFVVAGEAATDWEDVAAGPCDAGACLFFADIGDNDAKRAEVWLVKVTEPAPPSEPGAPTVLAGERVRFVYPDGPHDAETLLVHPVTGDAYVVTKSETGASAVYRLAAPLAAGPAREATKLTTLQLPAGGSLLATGGDVHPCAERFLLRTYSRLYEYRAPPGEPFERAFDASPTTLLTDFDELQAEAVAYLPDGRGFVTGTEDPLKKSPRALRLRACE